MQLVLSLKANPKLQEFPCVEEKDIVKACDALEVRTHVKWYG